MLLTYWSSMIYWVIVLFFPTRSFFIHSSCFLLILTSPECKFICFSYFRYSDNDFYMMRTTQSLTWSRDRKITSQLINIEGFFFFSSQIEWISRAVVKYYREDSWWEKLLMTSSAFFFGTINLERKISVLTRKFNSAKCSQQDVELQTKIIIRMKTSLLQKWMDVVTCTMLSSD